MNKSISGRPGQIPRAYSKIILERDGPNCSECNERMILPDEYKYLNKRIKYIHKGYQKPLQLLKFSFGHVKPNSLGGEDTLENIVGEHFWCNQKKGADFNISEKQLVKIKGYAKTYLPKLMQYLEKKYIAKS